MEHRIVMLEHPARLSIDLGRLRIERQGQAPVFILPADIDVLCLHHHTITLSNAVLQHLTESGTVIMVTNGYHEPCAMLYPLRTQARQSLRLRRQIDLADTDIPMRLWQQIVKVRIMTQAMNLRAYGRNGALYLERILGKVALGDKHNHEGQASRHYWKHLFNDKTYRRIKQGASDALNARLNFGYAVLRSLLARQLAVNGLNLSLGIGHHSTENPFNLADDFMEPYRFLVERRVLEMVDGEGELPPALDSYSKQQVLAFVTHTVALQRGTYRLSSAVEEAVTSYCQILNGKAKQLVLPIA